nr:hypothetical protein [Pseudomonas syringae pv. actinidiae]
MSERELNIVMRLTARQIRKRRYRRLLEQYAGELAPPCVAEALQSIFKDAARK